MESPVRGEEILSFRTKRIIATATRTPTARAGIPLLPSQHKALCMMNQYGCQLRAISLTVAVHRWHPNLCVCSLPRQPLVGVDRFRRLMSFQSRNEKSSSTTRTLELRRCFDACRKGSLLRQLQNAFQRNAASAVDLTFERWHIRDARIIQKILEVR
jgi:hypothetical protein